MASPEGKISNSSTKVLFVPKLPPSLSNWETLKTHFSQYGNVEKVAVNPQERWCTVCFKTVTDAEAAKSDGCVWKNKAFDSYYWLAGKSLPPFDRRSVVENVFTYSDLDALWSDEDVENFGVIKSKPSGSSPVGKPKDKSQPTVLSDRKKKSDILVKRPKQKLKLYSEKMAKLREVKNEFLKDEGTKKEVKKRAKIVSVEIGKQKRFSVLKKKKEVGESAPVGSVGQSNLSLKDKFIILEERDKLIRKGFVKSSDIESKAIVGTCPDMCPEKERIMREFQRLVSFYEMVPGTQLMDHALAVKAYVRSSADQEEPLPHELRPEPVLSMTMSYLINEIMPLIEDPNVNVSEWYDFCWDRLRGIRKDIIQQQLCDLETVTIIEQCARFHICCYDRFAGADPLVFDEKINTENLLNCLQTLRHMYNDLSKEFVKCPNEAEFTAYMILLNLKTGDLMATYQQFPENLQKSEWIQSTVKIYLTFNNSMYSQFFKLVKKSTYLVSCLLHRYFYAVRVTAIQTIARAYCPPNKAGTIPLNHMMMILKFDTLEDTKLFCEGHGLLLKDNQHDFRLYRNDFILPENKIVVENSSSLVTEKRLPLVEAVVGNGKYNFRDYKNHKVHSSFTVDGKLNEFASDASDQKHKSSEMFVDAVGKMEEGEGDNDGKINFGNAEMIADNVYREVKAKGDQFTAMDVDAEQLQSAQIGNNFSFSNNDLVSRKQHMSSSFRFDLKHPYQISRDSASQSEQTSPFKFSLGTTPVFDSTNVPLSSFSYQLTPNQFGLKYDSDNLPASSDKLLSNELLADYEDSQPAESFDKKDSSEIRIVKKGQSSYSSKSKKPFDNKSFKLKNAAKSLLVSDNNDGFSLPNTTVIGNQLSNGFKNTDEKNFGKSISDTVITSKRSSSNESTKINSAVKVSRDSVDSSKNFEVLKSDFNFGDALMFRNSLYVKEKEKNVPENIDTIMIEKEKLNRKEAEEEERRRKKLRLKEEQIMKKLRKDLRQKMKATTARYFIRKWKQKVEKIKQQRIEFPVLISVPADQHISIWGTAVNVSSLSSHSLVNRLKEKRQNIKAINAILDNSIQSAVPYLGHEIAYCIANSNRSKLNLKDFNVPLYWKLVVSVPSLKGNEFFMNKFKSFIKNLFYKTECSVLGSVVKEITSENVVVYYCVHVVFGNDFHNEKDKITGMSGVLFFTIDGIENSVDKCMRFKNLLTSDLTTKPVSVALMKIGKEYDVWFDKIFNEKFIKDKIFKSIEEYWCDFNSVKCVVNFLLKNVNLFSSVRIYTLSSLSKQIAEHIYGILTMATTISEEFQSVLTDPNVIINFYNSFFNSLEDMVLDSEFNDYDVVPFEFKQYVEYFYKPGESHQFDVTFNKSHRSSIVKAFSRLKLPNFRRWPPYDDHDLLNTFNSYLEKINCYHILPRVFRVIDFKDDGGNVDFIEFITMQVSWINVVDLIVNSILQLHCDEMKNSVVICDMNNVSDLLRVDFSFKLLQCLINK